MKTKLIVSLFVIFGGISIFLNAASGAVMYLTTMKYNKTHTAWLAAESCLKEAESNMLVKRTKYKSARPEVISTEQMACIARARNIVKGN